jgi:type IV pilus assembly protein PilO
MAKLSLSSLPIEKVGALSRVQRILVCVCTFLVLGGGYFYLIYVPKSGRIDELKQNYEDLQVKVAKAKAAAKDLDKYQKQYQEAQGKFRLVLKLLPDKKEIPSLLEGISKSGRHAGLEFLLFQPEPEVPKGFYAEIPVKIQVVGGYHNLALFFDKVARLSRIVNISNVDIKGARGSKAAEGELETSCVATTFRFVEAAKTTVSKGKSKKAG